MLPRTVLRIEVAGPDRKARRLCFGEDTADCRTTSAAVVRALALEEGDLLDLEQLSAVEGDLARDRAVRYLGYRDRSAYEIVKRLLDDGYPQKLADAVCDRLRELGYVDDSRLAYTWARSRASSGYGPRRILQDLSRRGVADNLARDAVSAVTVDTESLARAAIGSRQASDRKGRERLVRRLLSRGFDLSTALKVTEFEDFE